MFFSIKKISIPHFYCMEYSEGGRTMTIDIDFREPEIYISKSLITKWNSPYENENITVEKRNEIYKELKLYLIKRFGKDKVIEE